MANDSGNGEDSSLLKMTPANLDRAGEEKAAVDSPGVSPDFGIRDSVARLKKIAFRVSEKGLQATNPFFGLIFAPK